MPRAAGAAVLPCSQYALCLHDSPASARARQSTAPSEQQFITGPCALFTGCLYSLLCDAARDVLACSDRAATKPIQSCGLGQGIHGHGAQPWCIIDASPTGRTIAPKKALATRNTQLHHSRVNMSCNAATTMAAPGAKCFGAQYHKLPRNALQSPQLAVPPNPAWRPKNGDQKHIQMPPARCGKPCKEKYGLAAPCCSGSLRSGQQHGSLARWHSLKPDDDHDPVCRRRPIWRLAHPDGATCRMAMCHHQCHHTRAQSCTVAYVQTQRLPATAPTTRRASSMPPHRPPPPADEADAGGWLACGACWPCGLLHCLRRRCVAATAAPVVRRVLCQRPVPDPHRPNGRADHVVQRRDAEHERPRVGGLQ